MPRETAAAWSAWRLWPLALLALFFALFFALGLHRALSPAGLQAHHARLAAFVAAHRALGALAFVLAYAGIVLLSLPGATVMTLAAGLLFGPWLGTLYAVLGATLGASLLFFAAQSAVGDALRRRAGPWLEKLARGFRRDAWSYMLILRLVPLFPFFAVNLVPAFLGIGWACFVITTFFGIMPGAFVYALAGAGLGEVLASGAAISLEAVLSPKILAALSGLAALAALPALYRRLARKGEGDELA